MVRRCLFRRHAGRVDPIEEEHAGHSLLDSNQLAARRVLMLVSTEGPEAVADAAGELEALISRSRALTAGTLVRALLRLSPLIPRRRRPDR